MTSDAAATGTRPGSSIDRARTFLTAVGLQAHDEAGRWTPLTGGVSSDLWRVDLPGQTVCVKGALAQLRVADEWRAPTSRNAVEYAWLEFAAKHRPHNVPKVYARDDDAGFFVMEFLAPETHPNWKTELLSGVVVPDFAGAVGDLVGALQSSSTRDPDLPTRFATDANFAVLRLNPYLRVTAARNPAVAARLLQLADQTAATHLALVHGDVSPKNILVSAEGPILLDAECAWFGDPAFDVAFCLTHLALKLMVLPQCAPALAQSARDLVAAHAAHVDWEDVTGLNARVAALLPALLLARIDGSSPVEYLADPQRTLARRIATAMLVDTATDPIAVLTQWHDSLR